MTKKLLLTKKINLNYYSEYAYLYFQYFLLENYLLFNSHVVVQPLLDADYIDKDNDGILDTVKYLNLSISNTFFIRDGEILSNFISTLYWYISTTQSNFHTLTHLIYMYKLRNSLNHYYRRYI